jgi:hypothetical protein
MSNGANDDTGFSSSNTNASTSSGDDSGGIINQAQAIDTRSNAGSQGITIPTPMHS